MLKDKLLGKKSSLAEQGFGLRSFGCVREKLLPEHSHMVQAVALSVPGTLTAKTRAPSQWIAVMN